jgi:CheY-like chemotaxis protein
VIWILSDNATTRSSLLPLIRGKGFAVSETDCDAHAAQRARFHPPKLVIIDCGMPDSFNTLQELRGDPYTQSIPVVMFSIDDKDLRQEALLRGANAYVGKGSMDWAELLTEIVRLAGPPGPA